MEDYTEKRDHFRMAMGCEIQLHHKGNKSSETVILEDLSAAGMRFFIDHQLDEGSKYEVTVTPTNDITPPMQAQITVLRCNLSDDQRYDVAATIDAIEPAAYPEAESA